MLVVELGDDHVLEYPLGTLVNFRRSGDYMIISDENGFSFCLGLREIVSIYDNVVGGGFTIDCGFNKVRLY